jgi:hypothetical protein
VLSQETWRAAPHDPARLLLIKATCDSGAPEHWPTRLLYGLSIKATCIYV